MRLRALERLAQQGDTDAQQQLGDTYADGVRDPRGKVLVRRNLRRAERWLTAGALAGHGPSMLSLGNLLALRADFGGARRWYGRAARDPGLAGAAASNMATISLQTRQYARALSWFERSRSAGDGDAAVSCAYMKYYGIGVRSRVPHACRGLTRTLAPRCASPYALDEAHYLEAVATLDHHKRIDRGAIARLLSQANRDGDYPQAESLLEDLRRGLAVRVRCRCRRGRPTVWAQCSPCDLHRTR